MPLPTEAHTHLVLPHPVAEVQKDLVAVDLVFIRRVIVKAVPSESFVLELKETQRWHLGPDLHTPRDVTQS